MATAKQAIEGEYCLWVTERNERACRFYEKQDLVTTVTKKGDEDRVLKYYLLAEVEPIGALHRESRRQYHKNKDAAPRLRVKLGIYKPPDVAVVTSTVFTAGEIVHALNRIGSIGDNRKVISPAPDE